MIKRNSKRFVRNIEKRSPRQSELRKIVAGRRNRTLFGNPQNNRRRASEQAPRGLAYHPKCMQTVLSIAGFDPSSGAGVTADLMVFAAHGLFGTSCITSLTVQSTLGVRSSHPVDGRIVTETLACLHDDVPAAGIKIGMLGTSEVVETVAVFLEGLRHQGSAIPVVVDPVIRSSSGRELLDAAGVELLLSRLLPLADWVTPNLDELSLLTGNPVADQDQVMARAQELQAQIAARCGRRIGVLAKGGHLASPDDFVLTSDGRQEWLRGERVETSSTHGTGCALSSALLSRLVLGDEAVTAALAAKLYVTEALRRAVPIGRGHGPMNHLWPLDAGGSNGFSDGV